MPKNGRRSLLKMLGMSPALLIPWKPASEQAVPPAPALPEKLTLHEALDRVDWSRPTVPPQEMTILDLIPGEKLLADWQAMRLASTYTATACMGYPSWPRREDDDGSV